MKHRLTILVLAAVITARGLALLPAAAQSTPVQSTPVQSLADPPLTISIDDLAGPSGPGSARPKHEHWKMEPGYGWWGPDGDFADGSIGDGFDDGWLW